MAIGGAVELLHANRIQGWALDTSNANPAVLDLCIEGHKVKRIKALRRRRGFENLVSLGAVGFRFKLHPSLLAYVRDRSAVTLELNETVLPVLDNQLALLPASAQKDPAEIKQLLEDGYVITKHGELRKSIRLDEQWQEDHFSFYTAARRAFQEAFGYDLYLVYGGLLGLVRERALIAADDDLDTSYLSRHEDPLLVKEEFVQIHTRLRQLGHRTAISTGRRNFLKWRSPAGTALIDVFPSWTWGNHYFLSAGVGAEDAAESIRMGFETVQWYGHDVCVPKAASTILEATYGAGWKVPDPLFQWVVPRFAKRGIKRITLSPDRVAELNSLPVAPVR